MTQLLLPGIEEADFENKLWFLHDPYVWLDDPLAYSVFTWERFEDMYAAWLAKNVKNPVDNQNAITYNLLHEH